MRGAVVTNDLKVRERKRGKAAQRARVSRYRDGVWHNGLCSVRRLVKFMPDQ